MNPSVLFLVCFSAVLLLTCLPAPSSATTFFNTTLVSKQQAWPYTLPNARTFSKNLGPPPSKHDLELANNTPKMKFSIEEFPRLFRPENVYADEPPTIYGANLGCWFILESWCVPSMFQKANNPNVVDEWTWGQYLGNTEGSNGYNLLYAHWTSWVTDDDLQNLKNNGITHVRIPLGYWVFLDRSELDQYGEPYVVGQLPVIQQYIATLKSYGFQILIDLHGAPGSQNGNDHSGHKGPILWGTTGGQPGDTIQRTLEVVSTMSTWIKSLENDISTSGAVFGIELLNEPTIGSIQGQLNTLQNYYIAGYGIVRQTLDQTYSVVIQDGYWNSWIGFMPPPNYQNVILDSHVYHCFSPNNMTQTQHIAKTCGSDKSVLASQTLWVMVGEWSIESGTSQFDADSVFGLRWGLAEMNAYETASGNSLGWFYWNFKTDGSSNWNYLQQIDAGTISKTFPSTEKDASACYWWCNKDCCYANQGASQASIQSSLNWVCSNTQNVCNLFQDSGDVFYNPNDLIHHADVAFQEWWSSDEGSQDPSQGCNFEGAATYCASGCAQE